MDLKLTNAFVEPQEEQLLADKKANWENEEHKLGMKFTQAPCSFKVSVIYEKSQTTKNN